MVECGGLENRYPRKGIIGSNPILSVLPVQNDVAVEVRGKPRTADAAGFEGGFEGSTVYKYDARHICSAGGRPVTKWRAPNPILSAMTFIKKDDKEVMTVLTTVEF